MTNKSFETIFDEKTQQELGHYVYMLIDPRNDKPFYVGKGSGNRVFDHIRFAMNNPTISTEKCDTIREIGADKIKHVIITHGLKTEDEAYRIEAILIDVLNYTGLQLTNEASGQHAKVFGVMTTDEIIRLYSAGILDSISSDCVIININGQYKRAFEKDDIYKATKEIWRIAKWRLKKIKYVLSEYRGLIVEVFEVENWYPKERPYGIKSKKAGQTYIGYGFDGHIAPDEIRRLYINKSIAHQKGKGKANPISYSIKDNIVIL